MIKKIETLSYKLTITNLLGIHARSAAKIAKIAHNAKQNVWITAKGNKVDAESIIDILTLGGSMGTEVLIEIETSEDFEILRSICSLFESKFGEE